MAVHKTLLASMALAFAALASAPAHAQLFGDDEARRAILDLRQRFEAQRLQTERQAAQSAAEMRRIIEETALARPDIDQLRRAVLDLSTQIDTLRGELARVRGTDEQLARDVSELQRRQKDLAQAVEQRLQVAEDRLKRVEPTKVTVDGREFTADPAEQRDFDAALGVFRKGDFAAAQNVFTEFVRRYPQSGYTPSARFWLGNARYANRDYNGALADFRALLQQAPDHARAPEAVLSIANCQIELKDAEAARRTLQDLVTAYPQSEAASAARERLSRLR
jgi:tol-pal system protein YbgF